MIESLLAEVGLKVRCFGKFKKFVIHFLSKIFLILSIKIRFFDFFLLKKATLNYNLLNTSLQSQFS